MKGMGQRGWREWCHSITSCFFWCWCRQGIDKLGLVKGCLLPLLIMLCWSSVMRMAAVPDMIRWVLAIVARPFRRRRGRRGGGGREPKGYQ